jgi:serine/threonine protein kinase/Tfp pilus assembly protein PilF
MIGQTVSHYKILEKLGEGGMGVVYKAEDIRLGRIVALKFPPADRLETAEEVERFNREARTISALNDPHIATIYELSETDGKKFIVLEYVPGGTLKAYAKDIHDAGRNLSLQQVVNFGIQIAEGLTHAHENGVVHRDLKPDNLLLTGKEQIKITDFGLAKHRGSPELTKAGSTLGTVSYMSPEQVRGEELDARSDLFSLGVILYQLATGQLPFRGEHEMAISYSILNEEPASIKALRSDLPNELSAVIARCLEKDKDRRFTSVKELYDALRALLPTESTGEKKPRPESHRTRLAVIATFAVVAIITIALIQLVSRRAPEPSGQTWIAVLPFENLSTDPDNEFFSDGLTDDIITQLSKIADMSVISRTSTMRYKNSDKSLREIGEELNVDAILEGSVRREGERVRIVSQLIDAQTDEHLWAERYDRELIDIFKIQSDVAEKISLALEVRLTQEEKSRINTEPTQNMAAYDAYLRGREHYYQYREEDNKVAIAMFKMALEFDPQYALAHAGLADAYAQQTARFNSSVAWLDSAVVAANKALAINAELAEAYKALGLVSQIRGRYGEALVAIEKALQYNPNYDVAIANRGWNLLFTGKADEAIYWLDKSLRFGTKGNMTAETFSGLGFAFLVLDDLGLARRYFEKANEINFYSGATIAGKTWLYTLEQRYDELRNDLLDLILDSGEHPLFLHWLGMIEITKGNLFEARPHLEKAIELAGFHNALVGGVQDSRVKLAYVLWQLSEIEAAKVLLDDASSALKASIKDGDENTYQFCLLAEAECIRGNRAEALRWLQEGFNIGFLFIRAIEMDPLLADLHDEPQFKQMVADFRTRIPKMRARVERGTIEFDTHR